MATATMTMSVITSYPTENRVSNISCSSAIIPSGSASVLLQQQADVAMQLVPHPVYNKNNQSRQQIPSSHQQPHHRTQRRPPSPPRTYQPQLIATISAGFDKGDYLIREERGQNVYFDFFEEAYNYATQKGFARMPPHEELEYMSLIKRAHRNVPGGIRFNTGRLLLVLCKKLVPLKMVVKEDNSEPSGEVMSCSQGDGDSMHSEDVTGATGSNNKLKRSTNTVPTDSETDASSSVYSSSRVQSSFSTSTSFVDSWE